MSTFSRVSLERLQTCHPDLVRLFQDVVQGYDCSIEGGARNVADEAAAIASGHSTLTDPWESMHVVDQTDPTKRQFSDAVDAAPYPVIWPVQNAMTFEQYVHTVGRFYHFAGYVKARAQALGIALRWGGDWDGDLLFSDQRFDDLDHFERVTTV